MSWIDNQYPDAVGKHLITSKPDDEYNCIAWAAEDSTTWWSHEAGYKWPGNRAPGIESLIGIFVGLGYEECGSGDPEAGYDKVTLYAKDGEWTHAARLLKGGKWASKLGPDEDIEHDTPECLCGDFYGTVHCFMRRPTK